MVFAWKIAQRGEVLGDDAIVAASERTGPCRARSEAFKIVENLARQRKKAANRIAALDAKRHHDRGGSLDDGEHVSRGHGSGGMIGGFAGNRQLQNVASERANHLA